MKVTRRSESGVATLEMALVLPLLLLVVFAIAELGYAFAQFQVVQNAAREAARAATLYRPDCTPAKVDAAVADALASFSGTLGITAIQLDALTFPGIGQGQNACSAPMVRVDVSFQHEIPLTTRLSSLFGVSRPSLTLPGTSTAATQPSRLGP